MPTTTAVFKFIPGQDIEHIPEQDALIDTIPGVPIDPLPFFAEKGLTTTNKVSDTIDVETSTRTIVREWASDALATEFATALQATYTVAAPGEDSVPPELWSWPGQLISVQVNP